MWKTVTTIVACSACLSSIPAKAAVLSEQQARTIAAWWVQGSIFAGQSDADTTWERYRRSPNLPYSRMLNAKTKDLLSNIEQSLLVVRGDTGYCGKIKEPTWVIVGYKDQEPRDAVRNVSYNEFSKLNGGNPVMINARTGKVLDCRS